MDDPGRSTLIFVIILLLILLNAVFSSAEIAVISFNDFKLQKMAEDGNKRAKKLVRLTEKPAKFLSTIQVGVTLAGFLASAFASDYFAEPLTKALQRLTGSSSQSWNGVAVVIITVVLSFFTLILGELVPKRIAMKYSEKLAMAYAGFLYFIAKLSSPAVAVLSGVTNAVARLFGVSPEDGEENVTEEEIRFMVDVGSEKGAIDPSEKEMIQNVFEFDNMDAENVMTHRTEVTFLMQSDTPQEWEKIVRESGLSRFPVCGETIDDIVGILLARDLYEYLYDGCVGDINDIIRPAYVVPETVATDVLFRNMQKEKQHIAVVVDEYGGFSGIVTIDDLIGEIVGEIVDEPDEEEEPEIVKLSDDTWRIAGTASIDEVEKELDIEFPEEDEDDYDTFGGFIFAQIDSVPDDGETFDVTANNLEIHVEEILDRHVEYARVTKLPEETPEEETDEEKQPKA